MNITIALSAEPMTSSTSGWSVKISRIAMPTVISAHTVAP